MKFSETEYNPETNLYHVSRVDGQFRTRGPLNVGVQLTRECNLRCTYCSEPPTGKELEYDDIKKAFQNIKSAGVLKVNLTGGEALLRRDLRDIVDAVRNLGFYVAIDSNATMVTDDLADFLYGKLTYFETTIDGTPETHNRIRGRYDDVIRGIRRIAEREIPVYVAMVLLGKSMDDVKHVLRRGHELGAKHVKYLTPVPKGRGRDLPNDFLNNPHLDDIWKEISLYRERERLKPSISMVDWRMVGKGSVILVNSDGEMVGSPSIGEKDCVTPLGNVLERSVEDMWEVYPYKNNHIRKYIGETVLISIA